MTTTDKNIDDRRHVHEALLSSDLTIPVLIAALQFIIQVAFHGNYGYFRDELYYIACSDHLAFSYVDAPPLSAVILAFSRSILGDSLQAIRFLPSLAGVGVVILAALMSRQMGGGRFAQGLAALSVAAAHVLLGHGRYFSMNAFDMLFWALAGYIVIRILTDGSPRLWILFGVVAGLGLLNKYSMGFLCIGLVAGLLLTSQRKQLASKWFWFGVLAAFVAFLPHIIWEIQHDLASLEFMRNASQQKNVPMTASGFIMGQFREMNYFTAPFWIAGLVYFLFHRDGSRLRALGWMFIVIVIVMVIGNAKVYYLAPAFLTLFAGGAVFAEQVLRKRSWGWLKLAYVSVVLIWTCGALPFVLPVLPVDDFLSYQRLLGMMPRAEERSAVGMLPQHYADMFGWEEMVKGVAGMYNTLTPEEQAKCVIFVRNYGEAGAMDFFGKKYGLPNALCGHNNYWLWGPGERPGEVAIVLGDSRDLRENLDDLQRHWKSVVPSFTTHCDLCMPYESGRQFFLCKGGTISFQKIWAGERFYI